MQRIWVLRRFGLKTGIVGIDFVYFSLNSGMVFEGMHYERIDRLIPNEQERKSNMRARGRF